MTTSHCKKLSHGVTILSKLGKSLAGPNNLNLSSATINRVTNLGKATLSKTSSLGLSFSGLLFPNYDSEQKSRSLTVLCLLFSTEQLFKLFI